MDFIPSLLWESHPVILASGYPGISFAAIKLTDPPAFASQVPKVMLSIRDTSHDPVLPSPFPLFPIIGFCCFFFIGPIMIYNDIPACMIIICFPTTLHRSKDVICFVLEYMHS